MLFCYESTNRSHTHSHTQRPFDLSVCLCAIISDETIKLVNGFILMPLTNFTLSLASQAFTRTPTNLLWNSERMRAFNFEGLFHLKWISILNMFRFMSRIAFLLWRKRRFLVKTISASLQHAFKSFENKMFSSLTNKHFYTFIYTHLTSNLSMPGNRESCPA